MSLVDPGMGVSGGMWLVHGTCPAGRSSMALCAMECKSLSKAKVSGRYGWGGLLGVGVRVCCR